MTRKQYNHTNGLREKEEKQLTANKTREEHNVKVKITIQKTAKIKTVNHSMDTEMITGQDSS